METPPHGTSSRARCPRGQKETLRGSPLNLSDLRVATPDELRKLRLKPSGANAFKTLCRILKSEDLAEDVDDEADDDEEENICPDAQPRQSPTRVRTKRFKYFSTFPICPSPASLSGIEHSLADPVPTATRSTLPEVHKDERPWKSRLLQYADKSASTKAEASSFKRQYTRFPTSRSPTFINISPLRKTMLTATRSSPDRATLNHSLSVLSPFNVSRRFDQTIPRGSNASLEHTERSRTLALVPTTGSYSPYPTAQNPSFKLTPSQPQLPPFTPDPLPPKGSPPPVKLSSAKNPSKVSLDVPNPVPASPPSCVRAWRSLRRRAHGLLIRNARLLLPEQIPPLGDTNEPFIAIRGSQYGRDEAAAWGWREEALRNLIEELLVQIETSRIRQRQLQETVVRLQRQNVKLRDTNARITTELQDLQTNRRPRNLSGRRRVTASPSKRKLMQQDLDYSNSPPRIRIPIDEYLVSSTRT